MADAAIPFRKPRRLWSEADVWLARAEQARRVAMALSFEDARLALAYAEECEALAQRPDASAPAAA